MTLVLAWKTIEGIAVIADTRFGSENQTVANAGPKIFSVPIVLNRQGRRLATEKIYLPHMGFAFAGNTFAGQATHALATTCLLNLIEIEEAETGPTVQNVADLYARCAAMVVNERRQWLRTDIHLFDGLLFGRSSANAEAEGWSIEVKIDDNGSAICAAEPVDFSKGGLLSFGSGAPQVRVLLDELTSKAGDIPTIVDPLQLLREVMDDADITSVDGYQQFAVAAEGGVELRPNLTIRMEPSPPSLVKQAERMGFPVPGMQQAIDFRILGFDLFELGNVGPYSLTATHFAGR